MDANQLQQTETVTWINPASSIEFQASINSKKLHQIESITGMKREDYNAAAEGEIQYFKDAHDPLDLLLTPNGNTILHIYITSLSNAEPESKTQFVKEILNMCPQLVRQRNAKGETPLHIAARYGLAAIVEVLIERAKASLTDVESQSEEAKEILRMTNQEGDTALHEAVRFNHRKVVKLLLGADPSFSYPANKAGETLLYMALERSFEGVRDAILDICTSPAYTGPLGRTALHAAALSDCGGIIGRVSRKIGPITTLADEKGWTPLHLAAYFNCWRVVEPLLKDYRQMAYMKDIKGRTALHIAASWGNHEVVRMIISSCPDCCELVDEKGWNALHFSIEGKWSPETTKIFVNEPFLANLLNEKDVDGNTALHHHFMSWKLKVLIDDPRVDKLAFNNQNLDIMDLAAKGELLPLKRDEIRRLRGDVGLGGPLRVVTDEDYVEKRENDERKGYGKRSISSMLEKTDAIHPVVATLIATVSFAAGITVPGGFAGENGQYPGSAVLARSTAFKAFLVTDSLALLLSTWAVLLHALRAIRGNSRLVFARHNLFLAASAYHSTVVALVAMLLAFVTGTYAVLVHHYSDIAAATWTMDAFVLAFIWIFTWYPIKMVVIN